MAKPWKVGWVVFSLLSSSEELPAELLFGEECTIFL